MRKIFGLLPIVTLFISVTTLNASNYDNDVLEIFSKVLPRFILMSNQKPKTQLKICILHEQEDISTALSLIAKIKTNYPNGLQNHQLNLIHTDFLNINRCQGSELIFLFNASNQQISYAVSYAKKQYAITASYDNALLTKGIELSLFLGRRVVPYINVDALKKNGIELDNVLLRISKIYVEMDQ